MKGWGRDSGAPMKKLGRFIEAFPIPTVRTIWLAALVMVTALFWGWK